LTAFTLRWNYSPLKEKVTLLPGGLFVCGKDTGSQNLTIGASSLIFFKLELLFLHNLFHLTPVESACQPIFSSGALASCAG
jgi:hypothetical protein